MINNNLKKSKKSVKNRISKTTLKVILGLLGLFIVITSIIVPILLRNKNRITDYNDNDNYIANFPKTDIDAKKLYTKMNLIINDAKPSGKDLPEKSIDGLYHVANVNLLEMVNTEKDSKFRINLLITMESKRSNPLYTLRYIKNDEVVVLSYEIPHNKKNNEIMFEIKKTHNSFVVNSSLFSKKVISTSFTAEEDFLNNVENLDIFTNGSAPVDGVSDFKNLFLNTFDILIKNHNISTTSNRNLFGLRLAGYIILCILCILGLVEYNSDLLEYGNIGIMIMLVFILLIISLVKPILLNHKIKYELKLDSQQRKRKLRKRRFFKFLFFVISILAAIDFFFTKYVIKEISFIIGVVSLVVAFLINLKKLKPKKKNDDNDNDDNDDN